MIPESLMPIANHLWQSTLFAGAAGLLTLALRKNSARVRHWVWVTASLKFLVPFAVFIALGSQVRLHTATPPIPTNFSIALDQVSQPFTIPVSSAPLPNAAPARTDFLPTVLWLVWACGFLAKACSWWMQWRRIRASVRAGSPVQLGLPIRTISSPSFMEPGVFGVFRPVLLLPAGFIDHLTPDQWKSVLAHELCHVRHRDNLIAAIHSISEAEEHARRAFQISKNAFTQMGMGLVLSRNPGTKAKAEGYLKSAARTLPLALEFLRQPERQ